MKYNIFSNYNGIPTELVQKYHNGDTIIIPTPDGVADYVYVKDGITPPPALGVYSLNISVTEKDLLPFMAKVEEDNSFEVGDVVFSIPYKKLPLAVMDVMDDEVLCSATVRHRKYVFSLSPKELRKSDNAQLYAYQYSYSRKPLGWTVIDGDYVIDSGLVDSTYDVVVLFLRIKAQCMGTAILWTGKVNKWVSIGLKLFELNYSPELVKGKFLISDKTYLIGQYNRIGTFVDRSVHWTNANNINDISVFEFKEALKYYSLKNVSIVSLKIPPSLINNINSENDIIKIRDALPSSVKSYIDDLIKPLSLYWYKSSDIDDEKLYNMFDKAGWVWFIENFDYYTGIIKG